VDNFFLETSKKFDEKLLKMIFTEEDKICIKSLNKLQISTRVWQQKHFEKQCIYD